MIRMANRLWKPEQRRLQKKTEEAKKWGGVSSSLFLEGEMNALSDANCFFFYGSRLHPKGLLTVFFPDEEQAEFTVAEFVPGKAGLTSLFTGAIRECRRVKVEQIHTVSNPAYGFDFGKIDGIRFTHEWSEYMLCTEMEMLAKNEIDGKKAGMVPGTVIRKEDAPEQDGTIRYCLLQNDEEVSECRILPLNDGKQCYLFGLKTKEEHRRKGMATALLRAIAEEYKVMEGAVLLLQVSSKNEPAERLYRALGFRTKEQRDYFRTEVADGNERDNVYRE